MDRCASFDAYRMSDHISFSTPPAKHLECWLISKEKPCRRQGRLFIRPAATRSHAQLSPSAIHA